MIDLTFIFKTIKKFIFFESPPVLPLLIKLAAARQFESELSMRTFAQFFSLREDPPLISAFSPQERRGNRYSSLFPTTI